KRTKTNRSHGLIPDAQPAHFLLNKHIFEATAVSLGIQHKLIRPYTPRHNGKVERSHREDQKHFYSCHSFYSLNDFAKQLAAHIRRSNNFPMRPLGWLSPAEFSVQYV
ncbi:integrase core domain-containing protein, partial [Bifidobacterium thermophilum]|uniref:integrase core domain-containing protein n=1 Tax=Bifidobacterium thermophilum TaxID=33905 RepID=UPI001F106BC1